MIFGNNTDDSLKTSFFSQGGYITINGEIANFDKSNSDQMILEVIINDFINLDQISYFVSVDTAGKFFFSFYLDVPQTIGITYKNKWPEFYVSPGDTLTLELDANKFPDGIIIKGKNSIINQQYSYFRKLNLR